MKVGVCMLVYNHEKYVTQAVESIVSQQTSFAFKLVIGEDCSTDKSREILIQLKQKYPDKIELLLEDKNLGMINNFYRTINAIDAPYVAFCEGDDFWNTSDKLQLQFDYLEANPATGLVFSNLNIKEKNRTIPSSIKIPPDYSLKPENLLVNNSIATCTVMCRKKLLLEAQDFLGGRHFAMGDYPLWLYVAQKSTLAYLDKALATYRIVGGSATNQNYGKQLQFLESQWEVKQLYAQKFTFPASITRQAEIHYLQRKMLLCFLAEKREDLADTCKRLLAMKGKLSRREQVYCFAINTALLSWPLKRYHALHHALRRH